MVNLFIFLASFISLIILLLKQNFKWYTFVLSFMVGAFLVQTILWLCGAPTIIK